MYLIGFIENQYVTKKKKKTIPLNYKQKNYNTEKPNVRVFNKLKYRI